MPGLRTRLSGGTNGSTVNCYPLCFNVGQGCIEVNKKEGVGISSDDPSWTESGAARSDNSISMTLSNVIDSSEDEDDVENEERLSRGKGQHRVQQVSTRLARRESQMWTPTMTLKILARAPQAKRTGSAESSSSSRSIEVVELIDEDRTTVQG